MQRGFAPALRTIAHAGARYGCPADTQLQETASMRSARRLERVAGGVGASSRRSRPLLKLAGVRERCLRALAQRFGALMRGRLILGQRQKRGGPTKRLHNCLVARAPLVKAHDDELDRGCQVAVRDVVRALEEAHDGRLVAQVGREAVQQLVHQRSSSQIDSRRAWAAGAVPGGALGPTTRTSTIVSADWPGSSVGRCGRFAEGSCPDRTGVGRIAPRPHHSV